MYFIFLLVFGGIVFLTIAPVKDIKVHLVKPKVIKVNKTIVSNNQDELYKESTLSKFYLHQ